MNVAPVSSPLPGEHLIATSPVMRPDTDARWRQRLNFWAGRSLTAEALELDQETRAARLAWIGRVLSPGIVSGLEVALEEPTPLPDAPGLEGHFLHINPGTGFSATGEDVVVPRPLRVALTDVAVEYLRLPRTADFPGEDPSPDAEPPATPELQPRLDVGGMSFALDRFPHGYVPWAAVLVLRPAEIRAFDNLDPEDPCELDLSRDAFADERRIDAAQLRLCQLPLTWQELPLLANPGDATWRNRLAYAVFLSEAEDSPRQQLRLLAGQPGGDVWDTVLREGGLRPWELTAGAAPSLLSQVRAAGLFPWELLGVPLALFSSEQIPATTGSRFFLDRASVVRPGGRALPRSRPATRLATNASDEALNPPGAGTPALWRARVDQFAEHFARLSESTLAEQATRFRFLPPAGLLPREALTWLTTQQADDLGVDDRADTSEFLPSTFNTTATPIPIEDLDAAFAASAALAPLDLTSPEEPVRLLVPLPERVFDPRVLVVERDDPFFATETARLVGVRQDWRQRRDFLRSRIRDLQATATGPVFLGIPLRREPGQLEEEPVETLDATGHLTVGGATLQRAWVSPYPASVALELVPRGLSSRSFAVTDAVSLVVRLDTDATPNRLNVTWLSGTERFSFSWLRRYGSEALPEHSAWLPEPTAPVNRPSLPSDPPAPRTNPQPGVLWLRLDVTAAELGSGARDFTGIEFRVEGGRIALGPVGLVRNIGTAAAAFEVWFEPAATLEVQTVGGDWTLTEGPRLLAPFESPHSPTFEGDLTLDARLTDLDTQLRLPAAEAVRATGLERLVERLQAEVNKSDDAVDLNFLKAQSNAHRARQVIMGEDAANELLTSPVLNSIVESKSARVAQDKLLTAFKEAPDVPPATTPRGVRAGPGIISGGGAGSVISIGGGLSDPRIGQPPGTLPGIGQPIFNIPSFPAGGTLGVGLSLPTTAPIDARITLDPGISQKIAIPSKKDVIGADPLIGQPFRIRTLSIAKRFNGGPALAAYDYAHAGFLDALALIRKLPLLYDQDADATRPTDPIPDIYVGPETTPPDQGHVSYFTYDADPNLVVKYRESVSDTERAGLSFDQGTVIARAIRRSDAAVLILRRLEYYIERRREQLERAREVLESVRSEIASARNRLVALEAELAESRHDVSVARALWQEERERVYAINQGRDALIRDEVKFLAYVRPRVLTSVRRQSPYWRLEQADTPATLPACLRRHDQPDPALQAYVDLFRNAPARWLTHLSPLLAKLDTRERLVDLLDAARYSSALFLGTSHEASFSGKGDAALVTFNAQQRVVTQLRQKTARATFSASRSKSWTDFHREAEEHVSVGDLADGRHRQTAVATAATEELENIAQVGSCLHAEFAAVAPGLRLAWVERFSQFDKPGLLRDLTILPQFGRMERGLRRRLQDLVNWLFGRVSASQADAVSLMNDFVRLCLLIASHAPVNQIIAGRLPRPTPVKPGVLIPIRPLNPQLVRVGMEFNVWHQEKVVARGVVQDLLDGDVQARVDEVDVQTTSLDIAMEVRFVPKALSLRSPVRTTKKSTAR